MAGLLAMGFLGGAAGEYLKQSEERRAEERDIRKDERTSKYQEIRDKRLSELRMSEQEHSQGLTTAENIRQEGVQSTAAESERTHQTSEREAAEEHELEKERQKPITLGRGQKAFDLDGNEIASGPEYTHAPNASSSDPKKHAFTLRGTGEPISYEQLVDDYKLEHGIAEKDLITGSETWTQKGGSPGLIDYINSRIQEQIDVNDPEAALNVARQDPDLLFMYMKEQKGASFNPAMAAEVIKRKFPDWVGPEGAAPAEETAPTPEPEATPTPDTSNNAGIINQGTGGDSERSEGMMSEGTNQDVFTGPIKRRIADLEEELAQIEGRQGRSAQAQRKALESEIAHQRSLLRRGP